MKKRNLLEGFIPYIRGPRPSSQQAGAASGEGGTFGVRTYSGKTNDYVVVVRWLGVYLLGPLWLLSLINLFVMLLKTFICSDFIGILFGACVFDVYYAYWSVAAFAVVSGAFAYIYLGQKNDLTGGFSADNSS